MIKIACPNRNHPDWIRLENAVGETEAFRDYIQYMGQIRDPFVVHEKLSQRERLSISPAKLAKSDAQVKRMIKATEKYEIGVLAASLRRLRETVMDVTRGNQTVKEHVISQKSWKKDDLNPQYTLITVPKMDTERDAAEGTKNDMHTFAHTKDVEKWNYLKNMISYEESIGNNMDFIDLLDTKDAYIIKVPTQVYEVAKSQEVTPDNFVAYYRGNDAQAILIDEGSLLGNVISTLGSPAVTPKEIDNTQAKAQVEGLVNILANNLLVNGETMPYEFISADQANKLHQDISKKWNGEKAFFLGNTVYFVGQDMSLDMVFHEFSHPVIRALQKTNSALFDALYAEAINSKEGEQLLNEVRNLYPEYNEEDALFKEEFLVRALTLAALKKNAKEEVTKSFGEFLRKLYGQIRQALRKLFNKKASRDVSKLDANTTLKDLAEMMLSKEESLELGESNVSDKDTVAYVRDMHAYIEDVLKLEKTDLVSLTTHGHDIALKHVKNLTKNKNYKEAAKLLLDDYGRGELQEVERNLNQFAKVIDDKLFTLANRIQYDKDHATAMVNSLYRLQNVMNKIRKHMDSLKQEPDSIDNMNKAFYYQHLVTAWQTYTAEFTEALDAAGVPTDSPLSNLVNAVDRQMKQILNESKGFYKDGAKEILVQTLGEASNRMQDKFDKHIAYLKSKGAKKELIDKETEEFYGLSAQENARREDLVAKKADKGLSGKEKLELDALTRKSFSGARLSPEKIEMALEGKIEDANVFNSFFEGYMYNTDPVVGGFALFVKNHMNDVMSITQAKFNDYAKDMAPLLKAAGYTPEDTDKLIQRIGRVELIGRINSEGKWEEKPVWTLKSAHKDWRIAVDRLEKQVNEAEHEWRTTNTDEAKAKFLEARAEKSKFLRLYFHQKYKQEVYAAEEMLEKDEIGKKAKFAMDEIFQELNRVTSPLTNQVDELYQEEQVEKLWQRYNQLFSLMDVFGRPKAPDSEEYKIAVRLKEYRAAGIDPNTGKSYREWILREGLFQNSLEEFKQNLVNENIAPGSDEYKSRVEQWLNKNLRKAIKPEFYDKRKEILDEIKLLLSKLPNEEAKNLKGAEVYDKIFDIMKGYRDDDGQPNGLELTPEALREIRNLEKELEKFKEGLERMSGLTKAEEYELSFLIKKKGFSTPEESARRKELFDKKNQLGLSSIARRRVITLYDELDKLQSKAPTKHYMEIINMWAEELGYHKVTEDNLENFYNNVYRFKAQNAEFKKWFDENHSETERVDFQDGSVTSEYKRSYAWNKVEPNDDSHYETTMIKDDNGNMVSVQGLPTLKYYIKRVKPEYTIDYKVGVTVDNMGNYLPRLDVKDSPFIDHEYLKMKDTDPTHFALLEKMKEHHLKNQEGSPMKSRLYLDIPRFRKNNLELLQSKQMKELGRVAAQGNFPFLTNLIERAKNFFRKAKDQKGNEYNWEDDAMLIRMDMFDNEIASIPVHGLYDIAIEDVSLDVNQSLMRYMFSLEKQKKLIEINPAARALQATLNDPANGPKIFNKINKFNFLHRGLVTYLTKKGKYVRRDAVNNFIEREFEGKVDAGFTKDIPFLQNASNLIFQRAGFAFFALNIPSALKNMFGAKFQSMIEASGGLYVDHPSMMKGEAWGMQTMGDISLNVYARGPKPVRIQIADAFDMIKGRAEAKLPESMSRTFKHDLVNFGWLYNFRKWTQGQAELQLGSAMLFKEQVEQNGKKISYMDAWEQVDGQLKLKDGIDVRYGHTPYVYIIDEKDSHESIAKKLNMSEEDLRKIAPGQLKVGREITIDNTKFKDIKNRMGTIQTNLNGAYDKFDQPEAQRYLAFRFVSFMKRYFTTMFVNRWGFSGEIGKARGRFNPGLGDTQEGTYITVLKTLSRTFTVGADYYKFMTPQEKAAWMKFTVEVGATIAILAILAPLLGWDPEDPERYEKLRQRSGSLPLPGVTDDPDHPFHAGGYLMNHSLKLALDVRAENEAFIPWPHFGLDNYMNTFTDATSVSFGPTLKTYKKILENTYYEATGNSKARYKKQAGPYAWQQEGGSKLVTEIAKAFGLTGSTADPVTSIKNVYGNKK